MRRIILFSLYLLIANACFSQTPINELIILGDGYEITKVGSDEIIESDSMIRIQLVDSITDRSIKGMLISRVPQISPRKKFTYSEIEFNDQLEFGKEMGIKSMNDFDVLNEYTYNFDYSMENTGDFDNPMFLKLWFDWGDNLSYCRVYFLSGYKIEFQVFGLIKKNWDFPLLFKQSATCDSVSNYQYSYKTDKYEYKGKEAAKGEASVQVEGILINAGKYNYQDMYVRHFKKESRLKREYVIGGEKSKIIFPETGGFAYFSQWNSESKRYDRLQVFE